MGFTTPCFMKNYDEEWKDVVGYEGLYKVSNYGRVKSLGRYKKIISGRLNIWGYSQVGLTKYGTKKMFSIHRLVAQAFIPNPNGYKEINHKDEDKTNNRVSNLEWCDRLYNMNYRTWKDRRKIANPYVFVYEFELID